MLGVLRHPIIYFLGAHLGSWARAGRSRRRLWRGTGRDHGSPWFPQGWRGVEILLMLGVVKLAATCLTVGTGGSAGDFGPSMVMGDFRWRVRARCSPRAG